ncbi:MAG: hypothetical protein M3Y87_17350 [Myxococcota bacterium]|nr:hypothetical protein [Myxococcota bacterium]
MLTRMLVIGALALCACDGTLGEPRGDEDGDGSAPRGDGGVVGCVSPTDAGPGPVIPPEEPLSHARLLRRVTLVLHGRPPLDDESAALAAATTDAARDAVIEGAIESGLASPDFYERMVDFGHEWMRNGAFLVGAQGDGYWGNMSVHLGTCEATTAHPGAFYIVAESATRGRAACDVADAPTRSVEPWWAPGTTVTLIGDARGEARTIVDAEGDTHDCGIAGEGYFNMVNPPGCGCGPNAAWCYPALGLHAGHDRAGSQRRDIWDEPARLIGHLAWHDRPLSDVVLGNYTVATNRVRAWYLRFGRQTGLYAHLDDDATWFRPDVGDAPRDPLHPDPIDPDAWRELVVETLAPQLLSLSGGARSADPARTLRWDVRTDGGAAPGLPMAGVMTMPGPMSSFPRERPRAARFLEIFACREFDPPPPEQHFPPVADDLATSGTCMHCHVQMDPVAMAFRRWIFRGYYVERPHLADLASLPVPDDLFDPARRYPNGAWYRSGAERWQQNWTPGTTMTPITAEELAADPSAMFLDTIPTDYTILGEHPDGTMGPLAFAKILVASGELDRCAVRRLYARIVGRELDPAREGRYIEALASEFAREGRLVRPFVAHLLRSAEMRRGL